MSRNDLNQVVAHTKFGFLKFSRSKTVVSEGDACQHIYFLMSGKLKVEGRSDDGSYIVEEELAAPNVPHLRMVAEIHTNVHHRHQLQHGAHRQESGAGTHG